MHLPQWTTDEYLEQLVGEKKITVRDKRTQTRKSLYVKTHNRNEALDLTVYCHAGLFCLQTMIDPTTFRDLGRLANVIMETQNNPLTLVPPRVRRCISPGI